MGISGALFARMVIIILMIVLIVSMVSVEGFLGPRLKPTHDPSTSLQCGRWAQPGFKFIPTVKLDRDEFWPQILPIAGVYGK